jgi:hypothetical protein
MQQKKSEECGMLKRKIVESWRNVREPLGINGRQLSAAPSPLSPSGRWGGGGGGGGT